jgi:hypothetical protein
MIDSKTLHVIVDTRSELCIKKINKSISYYVVSIRPIVGHTANRIVADELGKYLSCTCTGQRRLLGLSPYIISYGHLHSPKNLLYL